MGNLLRLLSRDGDTCCSMPKHDVFVDFENAQPTEAELRLYRESDCVLERSRVILRELQNYKGASREIRQAIAQPNRENEATAWTALVPLVGQLQSFYEFSSELIEMVPQLFTLLCTPEVDPGLRMVSSKSSIAEQLDDHQAIVKQLAKILEFVLKFDECKMTTPAVQNDFSYYRRTIQRNRNAPEGDQLEQPIPVDVANAMSLFFAHATPMLNTLSAKTSLFVQASPPNIATNTTDMLSVMAKVCQKMLDIPELKSRIQFEETELFILRVMVASIILYDHVHPTGAFAKSSCLDVKGCVRVLRDQDKSRSENLLNALRYTTKHLNDDNTPKGLKSALFDELG